MKQTVASLLQQAINNLKQQGVIPNDTIAPIKIDRCRDPNHGHYASNLALVLAKPCAKNPRELATCIVAALPTSEHIAAVNIAGPGFINFSISERASLVVIGEILEQQAHYGCAEEPSGQRIHMEYLSANPTGPLHVGHGRSAAYGACVANLLKACGHEVHQEYYVNDAGRQIHILATSVWLRYLQMFNEPVTLPPNAYQGEYIIDIAKTLKAEHGSAYQHSYEAITAKLPTHLNTAASTEKKEQENYLDALIKTARELLGEQAFEQIRLASLNTIRADIEDDLKAFGVIFDDWFPESNLIKQGMFDEGIELLKHNGYTYERDGALWFRAIELGDEKDRVLIRQNGQPTYFASDVAYHLYKYNQGYNSVIDIFGSDHHGYIARIRAFLKGLGKNPNKLNILLVQFAILYRGKERVKMSTRKGSFVTLRELREEVGNDAARFFYIMRKPEQHLDFDLELAKAQSSENPVYYIQYAHARICSVWRQLATRNLNWDKANGLAQLALLNNDYEKELITLLRRYPELIKKAGQHYEPHLVAHYLQSLANSFHTYYNANKFIVEQSELRNARLCLIAATQQVLANGLKLLGLSTPKKM